MSSSLSLPEKDTAGTEQKDVTDDVKAEVPLFSQPWKGSDLVLVVADKKLYVHRILLSMASPVFEAMFQQDFKEKAAAEVELPGKKADEMRDLVQQIYPSDEGEITMDNVEHLLKLADEYQMSGVIQRCKQYLLCDLDGSNEAAMKKLGLAGRFNFDEVRQRCYGVLRGLSLDELERLEGFRNLDSESTRELMGSRLRTLEEFLKKLYPQFAGISDCARYLWVESGRPSKTCPDHKYYGSHSFKTLLQCSVCKGVLPSMASDYTISIMNLDQKCYPDYNSDLKFDTKLTAVLEEMLSLLKV